MLGMGIQPQEHRIGTLRWWDRQSSKWDEKNRRIRHTLLFVVKQWKIQSVKPTTRDMHIYQNELSILNDWIIEQGITILLLGYLALSHVIPI